MPITTEIKLYLSGGAANADPNAALGGAISSTELGAGLHNLFDKVTGDEAAAGDVEYRCIYVKNTHGTLTWETAKAWISANTPAADTTIDIGLGTSAVNGIEQTVADESTAPAGVAFSAPANKAAGLTIGDLIAGQHKSVWVRRTITAAAAANNSDSATLNFEGDTAA